MTSSILLSSSERKRKTLFTLVVEIKIEHTNIDRGSLRYIVLRIYSLLRRHATRHDTTQLNTVTVTNLCVIEKNENASIDVIKIYLHDLPFFFMEYILHCCHHQHHREREEQEQPGCCCGRSKSHRSSS